MRPDHRPGPCSATSSVSFGTARSAAPASLRSQLVLEFAVDAITVLVATAAVLVLRRLVVPARPSGTDYVVGALRAGFARVSRRPDGSALAIGSSWTSFRWRSCSTASARRSGQQIADVLQLPDLLRASRRNRLLRRWFGSRSGKRARHWPSPTGGRSGTGSGRRIHAVALLVGVSIPTMFALWQSDAARLSVARWLLGSSERWPQRTYLTVMGLDSRGRLLAPRDERFTLEVRSDLPAVESKGDWWIIPGRGEPLAIRNKPASSATPREVRVRERTAEGTIREGVMVATGPGLFRYELPPSAGVIDVRAGGRRRLARARERSSGSTGLRSARSVFGSRSRERPRPGFQAVGESRQHLIFLPDTEVELTLVGNEQLADTRLTVHPGSSSQAETRRRPRPSPPDGPSARRRRWRSSSPPRRPA